MFIRVLGSAAGGGFPQWNCNCKNCSSVREGKEGFKARTQSSIAVSSNQEDWLLFNASPDILTQLKSAGLRLQPANNVRDSGIKSIVLMDAQIDHTTGLFMLRESSSPLIIYSTKEVKEELTSGNPIFNVLDFYCKVDWVEIDLNEKGFVNVSKVKDIQLKFMPLKSEAPPFSPFRGKPRSGDNVGVQIIDAYTKKKIFYAPGLGSIEEHLLEPMKESDLLLVDGTFWTDTEMIDNGLSKKLAREMGHNPQSGPGGMIEDLLRISGPRKILIHINNSNPILNENSPERAELVSNEIEVSYDGMEIEV
ncbi:MAG: pyrroloquinoline quinone biosynthesis protein PqqB [Betaproteobacteria bacterium TMED156]|nr:MAG: pyrroloquinoline quinone biosynthesis protein PqqB [Betaproteobacteria bacterium TMED156]|tara:strand:- start:435 stop:1355 length:921 start_codon:yes stop_codon:yes gene_type:complete